jgi:hypothetical protein
MGKAPVAGSSQSPEIFQWIPTLNIPFGAAAATWEEPNKSIPVTASIIPDDDHAYLPILMSLSPNRDSISF